MPYIAGSSKHSSVSFDADFNAKTAERTMQSATPSQQFYSPKGIDTTDLSQEIAKLSMEAFSSSQAATSRPQTEIMSPTGFETLTIYQKRKSMSEGKSPASTCHDTATASKKRHVEEKEARKTKRAGSTEKSSYKGSKVNHNLIEKRYRSSLNEKTATLREALPTNCHHNSNCNGSEDDDMLIKRDEFTMDGVHPDGKQSTKGAVLAEAVRYIRFLESKVQRLEARGSS